MVKIRIRLSRLFCAGVLFFGLSGAVSAQGLVADFYLPLPSATALQFFDDINTAADAPMITRTDIVIRDVNTRIIFDAASDGYESQYGIPGNWAGNTEIWGDQDCTNGSNPNITCNVNTDDVFFEGEVVVLDQNEVSAGDYFRSDAVVNLTRSLWASNSGTLLAGAFELFPTNQWGTSYVVPIGETSANSNSMFEQTALTIMASEDATTVLVDPDGPNGGAATITQVLGRGESLNIGMGGGGNGEGLVILEGATVVASDPVQVNVLTGDNDSNYESRFYTLFPDSLLSNEYYEAVGTTDASADVRVFVYNPNDDSISVDIFQNNNTLNAVTTLVIAANSLDSYEVPTATGSGLTGFRLSTSGGETFTAYTVVDDNGGRQDHDWGHVTTPLRLMGDRIRVGFAPGKDPNSNSTQNASPIWVIADSPGATENELIEICVDNAGDGRDDVNDSTGGTYDGREYDYTVEVSPLDSTRLYDNGPDGGSTNTNSGNQTGMLAFACDTAYDTAVNGVVDPADVVMAAAYGQDPQRASAGSPGFDAGTTIRTGSIDALFIGDTIFEDENGNGVQDVGEPGISGVEVTISTTSGADVDPDTAGIQSTRTLTTNANGNYLFDRLARAVDYTVTVTTGGGTPLDGFVNTADPIGALDSSGTVLSLLSSTLTMDFGYNDDSDLSVIGDTIFYDLDQASNGYTLGVDQPIAGVEVQLCQDGQPAGDYEISDFFASTSYSANNGADSFLGDWIEYGDDGLPTTGNNNLYIANSDLNFDNDNADPTSIERAIDTTGVTGDVDIEINWDSAATNFENDDVVLIYMLSSPLGGTTVPPGANILAQTEVRDPGNDDDGVVNLTATLAGSTNTVYIAFIAQGLTGGSGAERIEFNNIFIDFTVAASGGENCTTTLTNAQGEYFFYGRSQADYTITVDPNGYTLPAAGVVANTPTDEPSEGNGDGTSDFTKGAANKLDQDFGYASPTTGLISGQVWLDEDLDGINDIEETGLTSVTVELVSDACTTLVDCPIVVTDQYGNYAFSGLAGGDYSLNVIDTTLPSDLQGANNRTAGPFGVQVRDVTLPVGGEVTDQDFGYIATPGTGIIGDRVWSDANADGIQDPGEAGLSGVTLELQDGVCTPAVDCETATTGLDGDYLFTDIAFGEYTVVITDTGAVLDSYSPTSGPQSVGGLISPPVTINSAVTTVTDIDFGFDLTNTSDRLSISDRVWYDTNADGDDESGAEPGIPGVTVDLIDCGLGTCSDGDETVVATTTTDDNGDFTFNGVPNSSDYALLVTDRDNKLNSMSETTATGGNEAVGGTDLDTEADADNALDTIGDDGTSTFGYSNIGSIAGTLWSDNDQNDSQNPGEAGIGGVAIELQGFILADASLCIPGESCPTTVTAADGSYIFNGLPQGQDYTISVVLRPTDINTIDPDSNGGNDIATVTLPSGESLINQDFGYYDPDLFDIEGTVFLDPDKDGVEDIGELGIPGVSLDLLNSSGEVIATTIADSSGDYSFPGLRAGDYTVVVTDETGQLAGFDITSGLDQLDVTIGPDATDVDFGYIKEEVTGSISGEVWIDEILNDGGAYNNLADDHEPNLSEVDVHLCTVSDIPFAESSSELTFRQYDSGPVTAISSVYQIETLLPLVDTTTRSAFSLLPADANEANSDYGYIYNGYFDAAEAGTYNFYTESDDGTVIIIDGEVIVDNDGVHGDEDVNADVDLSVGLHYIEVRYFERGGGDTFVARFTTPSVAVRDLSLADLSSTAACLPGGPDYIATTTTDANGEYGFNGLPPGEYFVSSDQDDIPDGLTESVPPPIVSLSEGENATGVDIGHQPDTDTGVLSGFVWVDVDGDGLYDAGEAPIEGVTINVYDGDPNGATSNGDLIATAVTKADGSWIITDIGTGLPPFDDGDGQFLRDDYIIGYDSSTATPTPNVDFTDPTNLPNPPGEDPDIEYFGVDLLSDPDKNIGDLDFGFEPNNADDFGSISGIIYSDKVDEYEIIGDLNGYDNGANGDDELADITLNLVDCGTGTCDDGDESVISSTTTDNNGAYSFSGLLDGDYQVEISDNANILIDLNAREAIETPITIDVSAPATRDIIDQNAGFVSDSEFFSIGNTFFFDADGDGFLDADEPGIPGITIQCWLDVDANETPDNPAASTPVPEPGVDNLLRTVVTDEDGEYYCTSLPAGQYIVVVQDSGDYSPTAAVPASIHSNNAADGYAKDWAYALTLSDSAANLTADFAVAGVMGASISGTIVVEDDDLVEPGNAAPTNTELDGLPDGVSPDSPAEGVPVVLLVEQNGQFVVLTSTVTDVNGDYLFDFLPDGNYQVIVQPDGSAIDGFGQTGDPSLKTYVDQGNASDLVCDSDSAALCDNTSHTLVLAGASITDIDFAYQRDFTTTPVTMSYFKATRNGGSVEFVWETAIEVGNAGFQIYARGENGWELISSLIASVNDDPYAINTYHYDVSGVSAKWFALVAVSTQEVVTPHGPFEIGKEYGGHIVAPEAFDWSGVDRKHSTSKEVNNSVSERLQRAMREDPEAFQ
jgi:hypothetical protein